MHKAPVSEANILSLPHEAITRSITGCRPQHLPLARLCEKHGHIKLRHRGSHSTNDLPFGGRRSGNLPTAACWALQRELGLTRVPKTSIPDFLRGSCSGGPDPQSEGQTRGGRQGQVTIYGPGEVLGDVLRVRLSPDFPALPALISQRVGQTGHLGSEI